MNERPRIEKLRRDHQVELFDCGQEARNRFLVRYAFQNQQAEASQTYVALKMTTREPSTSGLVSRRLPPTRTTCSSCSRKFERSSASGFYAAREARHTLDTSEPWKREGVDGSA